MKCGFGVDRREVFVQYSPSVVQHDERHEPGLNSLSHVKSLKDDVRDEGPGVWWMLARSPYKPFTFAIKSRSVDQSGVNSVIHTGDFMYTNLESTSHW